MTDLTHTYKTRDSFKPGTLLMGATLVFSMLFQVFPELDTSVSAAFYHADTGQWLGDLWFGSIVFTGLKTLMGVYFLSLLGLTLICSIFRRQKTLDLSRLWATVICIVFVNAGLVNGFLKNVWGRPRPFQTELFNGADAFVPAWVLSDICKSDCSFVSSSTTASALVALSAHLLLRPHVTNTIGKSIDILGVSLVFCVGFYKISTGYHYLSDLVFAVLLSAIFLTLTIGERFI